jgi:hypothetical protein
LISNIKLLITYLYRKKLVFFVPKENKTPNQQKVFNEMALKDALFAMLSKQMLLYELAYHISTVNESKYAVELFMGEFGGVGPC